MSRATCLISGDLRHGNEMDGWDGTGFGEARGAATPARFKYQDPVTENGVGFCHYCRCVYVR